MPGTSITLNWTPPSNTISQSVEYKRDIDLPWIDAVDSLGASINNYTINGTFEDNRIYNTRVKSLCSLGGNTPFTSLQKDVIKFVCPVFTPTKTGNSITCSFAHLGGSINQYIIKLYDSTGTNVLDSKTVNGTIPSTVAVTFNSLPVNTTFKIRVELYAGVQNKLDCPFIVVTTNAALACSVPVVNSATIS